VPPIAYFGREVARDAGFNSVSVATFPRADASYFGLVAQDSLGRLYATGQGVPRDFVQMHGWFNLAARRLSSKEQIFAAGLTSGAPG